MTTPDPTAVPDPSDPTAPADPTAEPAEAAGVSPPEAPPIEVLRIVQVGDPVLRQAALPLDPGDLGTPAVRRLIELMRATMEHAPGVGLAAPQVGLPLQLAVLSDSAERYGRLSDEERTLRERVDLPFTVLVNPVLTPLDADPATAGFYEGCLSVPGLTGFVRRHRVVRVDALDEHGEARSWTFTGWPARIAQHEIDHLNGTLYVDRVVTRSMATVEEFSERFAGRPVHEAAEALGFDPGE